MIDFLQFVDKQSSNVRSDNLYELNLCHLRTQLFLTAIYKGKEILHTNS